MPPRIPILSAVRPAQAFFKSQVCQFSKTASSQALRDVNTPTSTSSLLDLDSPSSKRSPSSQPNSTGGPRNRTAMAQSIFNTFRASRAPRGNKAPEGEELKVVDQLRGKNLQEDYMRQMPRRFNLGDVYAPHDLSAVEMKKWRGITTVQKDLVDLLGLNPLDMYRNFSFISEHITPHGRIKKSGFTGLRPVNQRKLAKAIRRSIGLGLHPSVHRHPEILKRERRPAGPQTTPTGKIGNFYSV